ncbi:MAG: hypothetical protein LBT09_09670 [Planctomycetaceae bacterium]|nr:hypothetical protein [Planctomycetaceae bacterium]
MQIHYALFDQAMDMGGGNYWTWSEAGLSHELLTRFYKDFAARHLAPEPNKLGEGIWGGVIHIAAESMEKCGWLVLYREFDGGHDRQNRPNRFVILTAWIRVNELYENVVPVFSNAIFRHVSAHSKELPVPLPPQELLEETGKATMRTTFEKFVPFVNPYWDSHLQIENKPSGMDTTESDAFTRELDERFKTERLENKRIKDELMGKLHWTEELMRTKELEWELDKDKLILTLNESLATIKSKEAAIKDLQKLTTASHWQLSLLGGICGFVIAILVSIVLLCSGDVRLNSEGGIVKTIKSFLPAKKTEQVQEVKRK